MIVYILIRMIIYMDDVLTPVRTKYHSRCIANFYKLLISFYYKIYKDTK